MTDLTKIRLSVSSREIASHMPGGGSARHFALISDRSVNCLIEIAAVNVTDDAGEELARRLVACWNAQAGKATEEIEAEAAQAMERHPAREHDAREYDHRLGGYPGALEDAQAKKP